MAKSKDNVVMQGASGKIGKNLVFRQRGDQTIIAKRPRVVPNRRLISPRQQEIQDKFMDAALYAKSAMKDPLLKAAYAAKANSNQNAFNMAFKDFFNAPQIRTLNVRAYNGAVNDTISFRTKDVLRVLQVRVEVLTADQSLFETGMAEPLDADHLLWRYVMTVVNPDFQRSSFRFTLLDTPQKLTTVVIPYQLDP